MALRMYSVLVTLSLFSLKNVVTLQAATALKKLLYSGQGSWHDFLPKVVGRFLEGVIEV